MKKHLKTIVKIVFLLSFIVAIILVFFLTRNNFIVSQKMKNYFSDGDANKTALNVEYKAYLLYLYVFSFFLMASQWLRIVFLYPNEERKHINLSWLIVFSCFQFIFCVAANWLYKIDIILTKPVLWFSFELLLVLVVVGWLTNRKAKLFLNKNHS